MAAPVTVETDRSIDPSEYVELLEATGWGDAYAYDPAAVEAAIASYHFVGHVRDGLGTLVGYVCAFSDGAFATFIGELLVHPSAQRRGVGGQLLEAVEARFEGVPVFVIGTHDARRFFLRQGYTPPSTPLEILAKLNAWREEPEQRRA